MATRSEIFAVTCLLASLGFSIVRSRLNGNSDLQVLSSDDDVNSQLDGEEESMIDAKSIDVSATAKAATTTAAAKVVDLREAKKGGNTNHRMDDHGSHRRTTLEFLTFDVDSNGFLEANEAVEL